MDFTEETKKQVREKAMFKCCLCQSLDIEIHHIEAQKDGGSNDISNAAPLCPTCHERYGNNPSKLKMITQARDNWYEMVKKMYPDNSQLNGIERISSKLDELQKNQINLDDFKETLKDFSNSMINNMTLGTAVTTASGIANTSLASISSVKLGYKVHANMVCKKCGTSVGLLIGSNNCPTCGELISG